MRKRKKRLTKRERKMGDGYVSRDTIERVASLIGRIFHGDDADAEAACEEMFTSFEWVPPPGWFDRLKRFAPEEYAEWEKEGLVKFYTDQGFD